LHPSNDEIDVTFGKAFGQAPRQAGAVTVHSRAHLAACKVPRDITFAESLPKSAVGKILRRELHDAGGAVRLDSKRSDP